MRATGLQGCIGLRRRSSDLAINTGTFHVGDRVPGEGCYRIGSDIRKVGMNSNRISDDERSTLLSSLSGDDRQGHAPQSEEAISTQKQLKDEMSADLVDARKAEEDCKDQPCGAHCSREEEIDSSTGQSRRHQRV